MWASVHKEKMEVLCSTLYKEKMSNTITFLKGPSIFISARYCIFYAKKITWDAKNEMQCITRTQKIAGIDRTLQCKINF